MLHLLVATILPSSFSLIGLELSLSDLLFPDPCHLLVKVKQSVARQVSIHPHAVLPPFNDLIDRIQRVELHLDEGFAQCDRAFLVFDLLVNAVPQRDTIGTRVSLLLPRVHQHLPEVVLDLLRCLHDSRRELLRRQAQFISSLLLDLVALRAKPVIIFVHAVISSDAAVPVDL